MCMYIVQQIPDHPNPDYPNSQSSERLDSAMFSAAAGKDVLVIEVVLQEKAKLLYERLFPHATKPFQPVRELDHDLQHWSYMQLSEAANVVVHCITMWQIKRQGKYNVRPFLASITLT